MSRGWTLYKYHDMRLDTVSDRLFYYLCHGLGFFVLFPVLFCSPFLPSCVLSLLPVFVLFPPLLINICSTWAWLVPRLFRPCVFSVSVSVCPFSVRCSCLFPQVFFGLFALDSGLLPDIKISLFVYWLFLSFWFHWSLPACRVCVWLHGHSVFSRDRRL